MYRVRSVRAATRRRIATTAAFRPAEIGLADFAPSAARSISIALAALHVSTKRAAYARSRVSQTQAASSSATATPARNATHVAAWERGWYVAAVDVGVHDG